MDTKVHATSYKFHSFQLSSIICQNPPGYAKPIYDTLQELGRCFLHNIDHWHHLRPLGECVDRDEQESETSWCLRQDAHDIDFSDYEEPGEINMSKRICVLCCSLLEELIVLALGDDLHRIILSCRPGQTMPKSCAYDRAP
jgi:hypothetical protein